MPAAEVFRCAACRADTVQVPADARCPHCRGPLDYGVRRPAAFPRAALRRRAPTMWRYREALPDLGSPVSLGEAATPLVPLTGVAGRVYCKCEYQLPSGSYKDRGTAVLVSYLQRQGVRRVVEDSSGNAGASLAAYAARAGLELRVFCPQSTSPGKLAQMRLHGAHLERTPGPRSAATDALLAYLTEHPAVYASHLWHPMFLEGLKTLAFELVEQLDWVAPAAILCPVGAGSILLGLYRGLVTLRQAGAIPRLPRLVAVQAAAVDPVYRAFHHGAHHVAPCAAPRPTLAAGIALPGPVRDREVLAAVRASNGTVVAVDEAGIVRGLQELGRRGFGVEPTSAVVWPALQQVRRQLALPPAAAIVCILSGHGLKAAGAITDIFARENPPHAGVQTGP